MKYLIGCLVLAVGVVAAIASKSHFAAERGSFARSVRPISVPVGKPSRLLSRALKIADNKPLPPLSKEEREKRSRELMRGFRGNLGPGPRHDPTALFGSRSSS